eukprot:6213755-Pleurochrysis_carterae.AAC.1
MQDACTRGLQKERCRREASESRAVIHVSLAATSARWDFAERQSRAAVHVATSQRGSGWTVWM